MTRPRMVGSALSCRVALAVARNTIIAAPTATRTGASTAGDGMRAAATVRAPKAAAERSSTGRVGRARDAANRAPTSDPRAISDVSTPYIRAPPPKVNRANSGSTTAKFNPKVPITPTSTSGRRRAGVVHT